MTSGAVLASREVTRTPMSVQSGPAAAPATLTGTKTPTASHPLDLNTATASQLDALPRIGPATAQKIIDYRTAHGAFTSVDGLDSVPGIGPATISGLGGLVEVK